MSVLIQAIYLIKNCQNKLYIGAMEIAEKGADGR